MFDKVNLKELSEIVERSSKSKLAELAEYVQEPQQNFVEHLAPEDETPAPEKKETNLLEITDFLDSSDVKEIIKHAERKIGLYNTLKRNKRFSISSYASECLRKDLFKFYGLTAIDEYVFSSYPELRLHAMVGDLVHDFIQTVLSFTIQEHSFEYPLFEDELFGEVKLKGRIDAMYKVNSSKHKGGVILEIKTIKSSKYETLNSDFKGLSYHWKQALTYAYLFNKLGIAKELINDEIKYTQLLYVSKDLEIVDDYILNLEKSQFYQQQINYLERKNQIVINSLKEKIVPTLSEENLCDTEKCRFCPYQTFCHNNTGVIDTLKEKHLFNVYQEEEQEVDQQG